MKIKIDEINVVNFRQKEYQGRQCYFASCIINGYVNSISVSEEFYKEHYADIKSGGILNLKNVLAELSYYKNTPKVKLI